METETRQHRVSASQVANFQRCPRLWAWQHIAKQPVPEAQATALGTRVHAIIEDYYSKGTPPNLSEVWRFSAGSKAFYPGAIAAPMLVHIPPQPGMMIEQAFTLRLGRVDWTGRLDLVWLDRAEKTLHIVDHKTSADPVQWGKTPEQLAHDPQNIVYTGLAQTIARELELPGWQEIERVRFRLNYGANDAHPRKTKVVEEAAVLNPDACLRRLRHELEPIAEYMTDAYAAQVAPLELPAVSEACEVFGGCPFKHLCQLSTRERLRGIMTKNSLIADLLAKSKARSLDPMPADSPVAKVDVNPPEPAAPAAEPAAPAAEPAAPAAEPAAQAEEKKAQRTRKKAPVRLPEAETEPAAENAPEQRPEVDLDDLQFQTTTEPTRKTVVIEAAAAAGQLSGMAAGTAQAARADELLRRILRALEELASE